MQSNNMPPFNIFLCTFNMSGSAVYYFILIIHILQQIINVKLFESPYSCLEAFPQSF